MSTSSVPEFSSRFGFLMASIGFAVGLGNIWRFPYITGENGGGVFIVVYLLCAFGIGVPILMAELVIGRTGRGSPPNALSRVARDNHRSARWGWLGSLNLFAAFLIEVVYCGVVGWVLYYLYLAVFCGFSGMDSTSAQITFSALQASPILMLLCTYVGLFLTGTIVFWGVQRGIERAVRVLMPTLFVLLLGLALYNTFAGGMSDALAYLLNPDFSKLSGTMLLAAVGQAFFSIGVAMAGMMIFGAYLPKHVSIGGSALLIVVADTLVALVAGLAIFPAVFKFGLDPSGGPGLIFQTMPVAFAQMQGGRWVAITFFVLLSVAAITSMVGLVEPLVARLQELRRWNRHRCVVVVIVAVGALGTLSVLSYNLLAGYQVMGFRLNTAFDYLSNQILLPVGGLLIAIFVGWQAGKTQLAKELAIETRGLFSVWYQLIRYLVPFAVTVILLAGFFG